MFLCLTVEATYLDQNHWFIDGAFIVYLDIKNHPGVYMAFRKGMIDGSAKTQQINTTSFAETEMIVMYDNMPTVMWTQDFIEVQGYLLKPS